MRVRQHVLSFAAQQQALQALAAVRCHDDQVAVVLFGSFHNRFGHQIGVSDLGGNRDFSLVAKGFDAVQQRLSLLRPLVFDTLGFLDVQQVAAFQVAARVVRDHLQRNYAGAAQSGQIQACMHGLVREFSAIGRDQDSVVHSVLLVS